MLFDWFTILAQLFNFAVLVFLLKRFLYKPILKAVDGREAQIRKNITDATDKERQALELRADLEKRLANLDIELEEKRTNANQEIERYRNEELLKVKEAYQRLRRKQDELLREDEENFSNAMIKQAQIEVFAVSRKLIQDLADEELEALIIKSFCKRIEKLSIEENEEIYSAFKESRSQIQVRSAFPLSGEMKNLIQSALLHKELCDGPLQFEIQDSLVGGISLQADGYELNWNIEDYLKELLKHTRSKSRTKKTIKRGE